MLDALDEPAQLSDLVELTPASGTGLQMADDLLDLLGF
jgi:hypothetical protein